MAQSGQFNSGAESLALNKNANQGYTGFMQNYLGQLATASGAGNNPFNAGQAAVAGAQQGQANQTGGIGSTLGGIVGIGQQIASVGGTIGGIFGGNSGNNTASSVMWDGGTQGSVAGGGGGGGSFNIFQGIQ
jgi:hypothetical protein